MEKDIQRTIIEYLSYKGIFHWKQNNAGIKKPNGSYIPAGKLGIPDIICVINGRFVGIEVKTKTGKQSEHQARFQQELEEAGGKYILARDLDDVIKNI